MEVGSLDELKEHFLPKLKNLHACLLWRDASEDDSCIAELKDINDEVATIVEMVFELRAAKEEYKPKLNELLILNKELCNIEENMKYLMRNIPERMPRKQKEKLPEPIQTKLSTREPLSQITTSRKSQDNIVKDSRVTQSLKPTLGKQENVYMPEIDFLTVDEFEQIPKYQKGRLTYDQLNKFIEGFNEAFKGKYKIMKQKKSTLKDIDRKRYETYKSQENKDCKGCYFIVDEDLKDFGNVKLDSNARKMVTVLRHCGRIKEIRGGNLTRYKYEDNY